MKEIVLSFIANALNTAHNDLQSEQSRLQGLLKSIVSFPIKVLATFVFSPVLLFLVLLHSVRQEDNISRIRGVVALIGFGIATILAYLAGTFLGSVAGALFIVTHIGILMGLGFLLGTAMSIYFTVAFQILLFNMVATLFLKMSSTDVIGSILSEINVKAT
ncbi:hypothetical protein PN462_08125 [Spirulina sp. CS-785/01]|uniref:hypothetical protein n=1 Tax=Spirulina sp. CS-785/01 TaxID=3021716 RepID=UPI00233128B0|nr:hypothetical protein [Spirulina sp. CS-785/01]MDB9313065.1 hypothetical protein [Spirulina sp. CS-785/01]